MNEIVFPVFSLKLASEEGRGRENFEKNKALSDGGGEPGIRICQTLKKLFSDIFLFFFNWTPFSAINLL